MSNKPLQSFKPGELVINAAGRGGRSQLIIHKASFFWNNETRKQQITACGYYNDQDARHMKSSDWGQVNCKHCLKVKEETPISTLSL
jgi:hypothetical protein